MTLTLYDHLFIEISSLKIDFSEQFGTVFKKNRHPLHITKKTVEMVPI